MKTMTKIIFAGLLTVIINANMLANDNEQGISKSFNVKKGEKLYTELQAGDINIRTWDKEEVLVQIKDVDSESAKSITITYENKVVSVIDDNDFENDGIVLQVTVPSNFNLELKTRGGNIDVKNDIEGTVTSTSYGGDLSFHSVKGLLRAETNGGNIEINGNVDGILDVNTMGGDIKVGSINGKKAKVSTMGGNITVDKSTPGIYVRTYGGDISVGDAGGDSELITYGGNVSAGNINGNARLETNGGNLELMGAKGKVSGKTSGGNVDFKNIKGSVDVKTSAGEVNVELDPASGSESKVVTSAGSIELTIPSTAKVVIEARIHVQGWWKNAKENFKIQSDFDTENYRVDDENHEIVGTYVLNGGGSKINLRSVNDVITIKKK